MTFLLKDLSEDRIDAMIESDTLTRKQIQDIIDTEIRVIDCYCSDDVDVILVDKYGCSIIWINGDEDIWW